MRPALRLVELDAGQPPGSGAGRVTAASPVPHDAVRVALSFASAHGGGGVQALARLVDPVVDPEPLSELRAAVEGARARGHTAIRLELAAADADVLAALGPALGWLVEVARELERSGGGLSLHGSSARLRAVIRGLGIPADPRTGLPPGLTLG
jgi:hypothetical protein